MVGSANFGAGWCTDDITILKGTIWNLYPLDDATNCFHYWLLVDHCLSVKCQKIGKNVSQSLRWHLICQVLSTTQRFSVYFEGRRKEETKNENWNKPISKIVAD